MAYAAYAQRYQLQERQAKVGPPRHPRATLRQPCRLARQASEVGSY
jgi:hypothetical protein